MSAGTMFDGTRIVVAVDLSGAIGLDGELPWRLKGEQRGFKEATSGRAIIVGRKTWESIPAAGLAGREVVVVTTKGQLPRELIEKPGFSFAAANPTVALDIARKGLECGAVSGIDVCGGRALYERALLCGCREMLLTTVMAATPGIAIRFPWTSLVGGWRPDPPRDEDLFCGDLRGPGWVRTTWRRVDLGR